MDDVAKIEDTQKMLEALRAAMEIIFPDQTGVMISACIEINNKKLFCQIASSKNLSREKSAVMITSLCGSLSRGWKIVPKEKQDDEQ